MPGKGSCLYFGKFAFSLVYARVWMCAYAQFRRAE